ncbi:hypothetical protein [Phage f2b1]|nr:hypothetical protein [Phage f2b1]
MSYTTITGGGIHNNIARLKGMKESLERDIKLIKSEYGATVGSQILQREFKDCAEKLGARNTETYRRVPTAEEVANSVGVEPLYSAEQIFLRIDAIWSKVDSLRKGLSIAKKVSGMDAVVLEVIDRELESAQAALHVVMGETYELVIEGEEK